MKDTLKKLLQKQQHEILGNHSTLKICSWTKQSLRDEGFCYKQKFYGIQSHLCAQIAPSVNFCQNRCIFCWRPIEYTEGIKIQEPLDQPKDIIKNAIKAQRKLLTGFKGSKKTNLEKLKQSNDPKHFAISLSGEPLLYPKLNQLIKELHKQNKTTFVVTNGLLPNKLKKIEPPTQLYLSVDAPNKELFEKIDQPKIKDAWKKLNQSLDILKTLKNKTRTTLRITLIKHLNMTEPEQYAKLIKKAEPKFVEVKGYMFVGFSIFRLKIENMPYHKEVKDFAEQIAKHSNYKIIDEKKESRVVLLMKKDTKDRFIK